MPGSPRTGEWPATRWLSSAAVAAAIGTVVLLVLVALAAGSGSVLRSHRVNVPAAPLPSESPLVSRPPAAATSHPAGHAAGFSVTAAVALTILGAVLAGAIVFLVLRWHRLRLPRVAFRTGLSARSEADAATESDRANQARTLLTDIDAAQEALRDEADPRRGVLACWLHLERAVAASDVARAPGESPGELARRILRGFDVDRVALESLYRRYCAARFSSAQVDETARQGARADLVLVRDGLTRSADGAGAPQAPAP